MRLRPLATALALVALAATAPDSARAAYIVTFSQVGGNVIASGGGTIDINGLTFNSTEQYRSSFIEAAFAQELTGSSLVSNTFYNATISGPKNFGTNHSFVLAASSTGDVVGLYPVAGYIEVPSVYVSGAALADTATYAGQTLASLGLTPGSYVYGFGSGPNADTITVNIGLAASVPEPATLALLGTGLAGLSLAVRRRTRAHAGAAARA